MDRETAIIANDTFNECLKNLFGLLPILKKGCDSDEEFNCYQREIARLANMADLKILDFMNAKYPELKLEKRVEGK